MITISKLRNCPKTGFYLQLTAGKNIKYRLCHIFNRDINLDDWNNVLLLFLCLCFWCGDKKSWIEKWYCLCITTSHISSLQEQNNKQFSSTDRLKSKKIVVMNFADVKVQPIFLYYILSWTISVTFNIHNNKLLSKDLEQPYQMIFNLQIAHCYWQCELFINNIHCFTYKYILLYNNDIFL